ncbi:DUF2145 domain-containing protein [Undibacterium sp.]|jgi:hypothetical protein|uniref:DUF2145 domain-containing protein n=1 Tax=Undibacterium sp. TaxID=1914977 RepID=UPI002BB7BC65|nr:DUF2145 domain-containing protein [Undibacterium sp.]HTD06174.1 DUF2145 domain-containing protein [Undibacterium sp.]
MNILSASWLSWRSLRSFRLLALLLLAVSAGSYAGRSCEPYQPDANTVMKAMELALKTRQALDDSGAQLALIARVGQDLSKYNLRYSHMAIVWRDHPAGRWIVVHELNQCGTAESALFYEGLGNFFLDDMFAFEALLVVPEPVVQQKMIALLGSDAPRRMHAQRYNMLAYPFSGEYQNSNQWVLEMLAAASARDAEIENRGQAQAWLKMTGYRAGTIRIPTLTRLGARMFRANVAFDDQPFDRRMAGMIDTVTVDSVVQFLESRKLEAGKQVVAYP